jgi:hypothetical protein
MKSPSASKIEPSVHSANIRRMLSELTEHVREDVKLVDEPRFQALLETSAEVLTGLNTAFAHYDRCEEEAWKR